MSNVTFLGLGAMGQRMAARLLSAGHHVTVWNRSPAPAQALVDQGAATARTPREAAEGAEFVISMVTDDAAARSIWTDAATGALVGMRSRTVAIEASTVTPTWIAELDLAAKARGIALIDAPMAGSRPQAEAGQLIVLAGGEAMVIERARPILLAMGSAIHAIGPVGHGARLKLAVNTLFATQVVAMAEQLRALAAGGVDTTLALNALKAMPVLSPAAAGAGAGMLANAFAPMFPVDLVRKDMEYAEATAQADGLSLPLVAAVAERMNAAHAAGLGAENLTAVAKLYH